MEIPRSTQPKIATTTNLHGRATCTCDMSLLCIILCDIQAMRLLMTIFLLVVGLLSLHRRNSMRHQHLLTEHTLMENLTLLYELRSTGEDPDVCIQESCVINFWLWKLLTGWAAFTACYVWFFNCRRFVMCRITLLDFSHLPDVQCTIPRSGRKYTIVFFLFCKTPKKSLPWIEPSLRESDIIPHALFCPLKFSNNMCYLLT